MNSTRFIIAACALAALTAARAEVLIERTMLPEAHASSFAFGLPGGVNFSVFSRHATSSFNALACAR